MVCGPHNGVLWSMASRFSQSGGNIYRGIESTRNVSYSRDRESSDLYNLGTNQNNQYLANTAMRYNTRKPRGYDVILASSYGARIPEGHSFNAMPWINYQRMDTTAYKKNALGYEGLASYDVSRTIAGSPGMRKPLGQDKSTRAPVYTNSGLMDSSPDIPKPITYPQIKNEHQTDTGIIPALGGNNTASDVYVQNASRLTDWYDNDVKPTDMLAQTDIPLISAQVTDIQPKVTEQNTSDRFCIRTGLNLHTRVGKVNAKNEYRPNKDKFIPKPDINELSDLVHAELINCTELNHKVDELGRAIESEIAKLDEGVLKNHV